MNRRIKKWLCGLCGLALVVSSVPTLPMVVSAAEVKETLTGVEYTYDISELTPLGGMGATGEAKMNGYEVKFEGQYGQVFFQIPTEVDMSRFRAVTVDTEGDNFSVKLGKMSGWFDEGAVVYGSNILTTENLSGTMEKKELHAIGFMSLAEGEMVRTLGKVTFTLESKSGTGTQESTTPVVDGIQYDIPDLKDEITSVMGEDFIVGGAIAGNDIYDEKQMALLTKHFNAVTLGNELKPDCQFGYAQRCPGTETVKLNGKSLVVPKLDFSRAERMLDVIYDWNSKHKDDQIKVRGHVLTWHSQTPEWFFHVDYDVNKPFCKPAEMTRRHEWYIKSMAEYFTGKDSKYKGMFYGWDVVNEAVSDGTGTYRKDYEESNWWKVYQSNEFIINAFRFANKYMPADVELYYNDYNEWFDHKSNGIVQLVKDVQAAKGTRIDGIGMQSHWSTNESPTIQDFMRAARKYGATGLKVQVTELDMTASDTYDGTKATLKKEYEKEAKRYESLYLAIQQLKSEGVKIEGMTVWGIIDRCSWLQTFNTVGGAADGKRKHVPLLFDDDYQAKPCFWVFCDENKVVPTIQKVDISQAVDKKFTATSNLTFGEGNTKATVTPVWSKSKLQFQVKVTDSSKNSSDQVTVYVDLGSGIKKYTVRRKAAKSTSKGYTAEINVPAKNLRAGDTVAFDVVVTNGSKKVAYNDFTMNQEKSRKYYALGTLKSSVAVHKKTITIGKNNTKTWAKVTPVKLGISQGAKASGEVKLLWDKNNLYVRFEVKDAVLNSDSPQAHEKDSVEIFIDENNHKSGSYEADDKQYRINYLNQRSFNGTKCVEKNVKSAVKRTKTGYVVEAAFAWTDISPKAGTIIGLDLQVNDADASGMRIGTINWYDSTGIGWSSPEVFGNVVLVK